MINIVLTRSDMLLYKLRYVLVIALSLLICVLAFATRVEGSCNLDSCGILSEYCTPPGDYCEHTFQGMGYFDPTCPWVYCCVAGPCFVKNSFDGGPCAYCYSGDREFCGYQAGC
jgi:hypothetical protein